MSATVTHHHMDHYSVLHCLSIISHSSSEKLGSQHPPSIYLILQLWYACIYSGIKLLIPTSVGNDFIN